MAKEKLILSNYVAIANPTDLLISRAFQWGF
jgi:hypothetical protein